MRHELREHLDLRHAVRENSIREHEKGRSQHLDHEMKEIVMKGKY